MESKDLLIEYYDALSEGEFDKVADCYDLPCKLISLYGGLDCATREEVKNAFVSIHDDWKSKDISPKIGYNPDEFVVKSIQPNIDLAHTVLQNFDLDGRPFQNWNCTYVLRKEQEAWLISLATTNNKASLSSD